VSRKALGVERWNAFLTVCALLRPALNGRIATISNVPDWRPIIEAASRHLVSPTLTAALRRLSDVPADVREYFEAVLLMNTTRNFALQSALKEIIPALNEIDVEPVLLKGAASLLDCLYPDIGARAIGDIDLLISHEAIQRASAALSKLGYVSVSPAAQENAPRRWISPPTSPRRQSRSHHLAPQIHSQSGVGVELHHDLFATDEQQALLSSMAAFNQRSLVKQAGLKYFVLNPTHRVIHNIVHAQIHHPRHEDGGIELRQLLELCLLSHKHLAEINWLEVDECFVANGYSDVVQVQRTLASVLLGCDIPGEGADPFRSVVKLRDFVVSPPLQGGAIRERVLEYWSQFLQRPTRALNLLNPVWWPERIAFHLEQSRHRKW
jgi:hypothetical protein